MKIRRIALIAVLALTFSSGFRPVAAQPFKSTLAVQLWSFRDDFKKDVPGTLKRVRELGFTNVELAGTYGMSAQRFRAELDKAGLKAVSMHIELKTARDKIDEVIRDAKVFGLRDVGVPWINSPFTKSDCLSAIEVFNRAGKKLSAAGLRFFYHLHGYEFVPNEGESGTLFDLLLAKTDPRFVHIQLDTYHAAFPGQDPAMLLQKYPGRFLSLHLKDLRRDAVGDHSGDFREQDAVPIGQGKINWPEVLRASRKEGIRRYIVEDETAAVWQNIQISLKYLEAWGNKSSLKSP